MVDEIAENKQKMRGPGGPVFQPKTGVAETNKMLNEQTAEKYGGKIPDIDSTPHLTQDNTAGLAEFGDD